MGSTAQQHRVATGLFACLLSRSRKTRKRKTNCCSVSNISANIYGSLLTFIMIIYMGLLCGNIMATSVTRSQAWESCDYHATSQTSLWSASSLNEGNINIYCISNLLLILANDVELNPGPDHPAILVAIERLLPDMCGMCNQEYTVGRLAKPALQCGGCQQGFHEECLEAAFGSPSLPDLPGKLGYVVIVILGSL